MNDVIFVCCLFMFSFVIFSLFSSVIEVELVGMFSLLFVISGSLFVISFVVVSTLFVVCMVSSFLSMLFSFSLLFAASFSGVISGVSLCLSVHTFVFYWSCCSAATWIVEFSSDSCCFTNLIFSFLVMLSQASSCLASFILY